MTDFAGQLIQTQPVFHGAHLYDTQGTLVQGGVGGGTVLSYVNRAYDSAASGTVTWVTSGSDDLAGGSYPGPGVFGVDTSNVTIEAVVDSTLI